MRLLPHLVAPLNDIVSPLQIIMIHPKMERNALFSCCILCILHFDAPKRQTADHGLCSGCPEIGSADELPVSVLEGFVQVILGLILDFERYVDKVYLCRNRICFAMESLDDAP